MMSISRRFASAALIGLMGLEIAQAAAVGGEPPARALDLSRWKLTLPTDRQGRGQADEILQPQLDSFQDVDWFFVNGRGDGVVFRANCGGATTPGSKFPRSELREMTGRGAELASWSTADEDVHEMTARLAVMRTPVVKKHVSCAQIHDGRSDLLMVRVEGKKLLIERDGADDVVLDSNYVLGSPFDLKIEAGGGRVRAWRDGEARMDWEVSRAGCFFKAGCYTLSNPERGDAPDAVGEVVIFRLEVKHRDRR